MRGEGLLTDAEMLILRPMLGEDIVRDVLARWDEVGGEGQT